MNIAMIRFVLFRAFQLIGVLLILPLACAVFYREWNEAKIFVLVAAASCLIGLLGAWKKPENRVFYAREGFFICTAPLRFHTFVLTKQPELCIMVNGGYTEGKL